MPKRTVPAAGGALPAKGQPDDNADFAHEIYQTYFEGQPREKTDRIKAFLEEKFPRRPEGAIIETTIEITTLVEIVDEIDTVHALVRAAWMAAAALSTPEERNPLRTILDVAEDKLALARDALDAYRLQPVVKSGA